MSKHPFTDHIPNLRRYAIALLKDRSLADDLVQDTLERALVKIVLFETNTNMRAWLFTIMHNIFINQMTRFKDTTFYTTLSNESGSADVAEEMVTARDITQALHKLSTEQRELILLIGLEQLSYEQTAQVLNLPIGTVMSRLSRARERLQALLNGEVEPQLRRIK